MSSTTATASRTRKPAAAKPADAKVEAAAATLEPLFNEILDRVKVLAGNGHVVEKKKAYTRVSQYGRAIAYVNAATRRSVRVEIPQATGSGYDIVKVTKSSEVAKVASLVEKRVALLAAKKAPTA